jgi:hypothetical protein
MEIQYLGHEKVPSTNSLRFSSPCIGEKNCPRVSGAPWKSANSCPMNTDISAQSPSVTTLLQQIVLPLFPASLRESMERELPMLALLAYQLGVDVMVAEQQGLKYSEAVRRPEFIKMGRVYYGATNLLQWRLTPALRQVVSAMLSRATAGTFEPTRKLLFVIASRKNDPEAALCRFLLWVAVRVNLVILTWDDPGIDVRGSLDETEDAAEGTLRQLLDLTNGEMQEADFRPLHVLVADAAIHMYIHDHTIVEAMSEFSTELQELLINAEALEKVRALDARSAAMFWPGGSTGEMGSQQITDRFPQHFESPNAMEQRRSRLRKKVAAIEPAGDRFIDLLRSNDGAGP